MVRFRVVGQHKELAVGDLTLARHTQVVVETDRGTRVGTVIALRERPSGPVLAEGILRIVTPDDLEIEARNHVREREAFTFCTERISAMRLPMKLVAVEFAHSGSAAVFHFTSADRVDFRELVKDLARRFHTRIEMRQIGVRDAARFAGGLGVCGRDLCCATFLREFNPISVRMAKDQNLALNHDKLSGVCGRLKCCLCYEEAAYEAERKTMPKVGKRVVTPSGEARVKDVNVLKRLVRVQFADGRYEQFTSEQVKRAPDAQPPPRASTAPTSAAPRPAPAAVVPAATDPLASAAQREAEPPSGAAAPDPASVPSSATPAGSSRRRRRRGRRGRGGGGGPQGPPGSGSAAPSPQGSRQ